MAKDYYDVLGVPRGASKDDIKRAFRKLAREYHPDVSTHPEAETRFKEVNQAYEVLSDDDKRARYDRFGEAGVSGGAGGATGFGGFEDIFEEFFNNFAGAARAGARQRGPRPGADRRVDVTITFEESIFGVEKPVTVDRLEFCDVCDGRGAAPGSEPSTCPMCNGDGEVRRVEQSFLGSMVRVSTCPRCGGRGQIVETPCVNCGGSGRRRKRTERTVAIPAGVREGLQIQVRGGGDVGETPDAPNGNLYVVLHVKEHEYFKRRDNDVILDLNVNVAQAALGDTVSVPTVDGPIDLVIPAGTQTGRNFRLRGKGAPRLRTDGTSAGRGDQLIYITVSVPEQLTPRQRELFEQLAEALGADVQPQRNGRGFFDRVMDFFNGEQT